MSFRFGRLIPILARPMRFENRWRNRHPNASLPDKEDGMVGQSPRTLRGWITQGSVVVVAAVMLAILLRLFVVQTFFIPSESMLPTLQEGDRIVVDKLSYDFHGIDRGDIVVFSRPPKEDCGGPPVADLVKRIIGLPGETVSLNGHGHVEINGRILDETWLPASAQDRTYPGPPGTPFNLTHSYKIPTSDYFVMGDNRTNSCDSRFWGPIAKSEIVGKVDLLMWPIGSFRFF
jgi:signal peptidase I